MLTRGPYAHDVDGPQDRGPYAHAIPTASAAAAVKVVTLTYAGLAPQVVDWGDNSTDTVLTANTGTVQHTYATAATFTITLTDAAENVATTSVTTT